MTRRDFLRLTALRSVAAFTFPTLAGCRTPAGSRSQVKAFELEELTIPELQHLLETGRYSAVGLTKKYLARIAAIDRHGPGLNAVIELNPDALALAAESDNERQAKGPRGPLHGIPILIKDNIGTHDRMTTTAGSLALEGSIAPRDAFVVERLRSAGAVLLGKTNLSEWANCRSEYWTSGWSGRGGQTRNPYALDRNPCGSSAGSAVAVAANLCAVAVGTETDGSILCPASFNGIVGIKPTLGLVSRSGIIPIAHSQDTAGPMGRTVTDAAILLGALAGMDPRDPATADCTAKGQRDYTRSLDPNGLQGAHLGVARAYFGLHPQVDGLMETSLAAMDRLGANLIDPIDLKTNSALEEAEGEVINYEFKSDLNAYLSSLGANAPVHTLQEIIEFNQMHADKELVWFGQEKMVKAQAKGPLTDQAYLDALPGVGILPATQA